ncbi:MAG: septal ring lytic transglycosylase RlpA family protein [Candidatus Cyclobacteriaceae bacterium M2_1C_046]
MRYRFKIVIILMGFIFYSCNQEEQAEPYTQTGEASYYARMLEGNPTASGAIYRQDSLTAAHRFLPLGTVVKVTSLANEKDVIVEINDRGPFAKDRIIDLSRAAAKEIDMIESGVAEVKLEVLKPAPGYSVSDSLVRNLE